jgi:hypothetical protein
MTTFTYRVEDGNEYQSQYAVLRASEGFRGETFYVVMCDGMEFSCTRIREKARDFCNVANVFNDGFRA